MLPVVGVRAAVILPVPQVYTQQQSSDELVEIEQEEPLHDDSLRREYGEECVCVCVCVCG